MFINIVKETSAVYADLLYNVVSSTYSSAYTVHLMNIVCRTLYFKRT